MLFLSKSGRFGGQDVVLVSRSVIFGGQEHSLEVRMQLCLTQSRLRVLGSQHVLLSKSVQGRVEGPEVMM